MNIYQKLLAITNDLETVAKNLNVSTGKGGSYKAVSEADVLAAVKPLEFKHGVYSYPCKREVILQEEVRTSQTYNGTTTEKLQHLMRVETTYRFVNVDMPEEFIEVTTYGDGLDSGDKATGKAMTYADKYALLKAYKIQTGDDPDKEASPDKMDKAKPQFATGKQSIIIQSFKQENEAFAEYYKKTYGDKTPVELTLQEASNLCQMIEKKKASK